MYLHFWESTFPIFFPTGFFRVFVSGRCTSNQYQLIAGSHNLGPSRQSYFGSSTFHFFRVHFCVFYKFIFKKLSTNFFPWLSVSYVHGNNHIYLPFSFIFCLNWQHCLRLFTVSNLPACWGYNGVYIILIILLILSQND